MKKLRNQERELNALIAFCGAIIVVILGVLVLRSF